MRAYSISIVIVTFLTIISCDKPRCENKNPNYLDNPINSKAYNDELVKELSTEQDLGFWLKEVVSEKGNDYLDVYIYNENVCTVGRFLVTDWSPIEGIYKTKGVGYRNAKLHGFLYSITYTKSETILNFQDLTSIID